MAAAAEWLLRVPRGRVTTYGWIAAAAGNPRGARQVVRLLHARSRQMNLPWHRVVNGRGRIGLQTRSGYFSQRRLLQEEGVAFGPDGSVDLRVFGWRP